MPNNDDLKLEASFEINRTPSDYEPTTHFIQRMKERDMIEEDMVCEAIEDGEIVDLNVNVEEDDDRRNAVLRHQWLMTTLEVVVGVEDLVVQTAYEVES